MCPSVRRKDAAYGKVNCCKRLLDVYRSEHEQDIKRRNKFLEALFLHKVNPDGRIAAGARAANSFVSLMRAWTAPSHVGRAFLSRILFNDAVGKMTLTRVQWRLAECVRRCQITSLIRIAKHTSNIAIERRHALTTETLRLAALNDVPDPFVFDSDAMQTDSYVVNDAFDDVGGHPCCGQYAPGYLSSCHGPGTVLF